MLLCIAFRHGVRQLSACNTSLMCRQCATASKTSPDEQPRTDTKSMYAWQITSYDGLDGLKLNKDVARPLLKDPHDVLIQVHAASLNPIDLVMTKGYGRNVLNLFRRAENSNWCDPQDLMSLVSSLDQAGDEFPLTTGRDCSGVVVDAGKAVTSVKPGDDVWMAVPVHRQGTHAHYVSCPESAIAKKPKNLSHEQAASIPYTGMTAWSALNTMGGLDKSNTASKNVLILGASGGLGKLAVQLVKAWGGFVIATCSTDATPSVRDLGADCVIDYKERDVWSDINHMGLQCDFILDLVGGNADSASKVLRPWSMARYVDVASPLMKYTDEGGLGLGLARSALEAATQTVQGLQVGASYRWAYFIPDGNALSEIGRLVEEEKIQPVVEQVYPFENTDQAFVRLSQKHMRGKLVVSLDSQRTVDV